MVQVCCESLYIMPRQARERMWGAIRRCTKKSTVSGDVGACFVFRVVNQHAVCHPRTVLWPHSSCCKRRTRRGINCGTLAVNITWRFTKSTNKLKFQLLAFYSSANE